ncbi:hypothetical protein SHEWT2_04093 [Shewanella hafniensis]|nr:hypothetical protein SHEWT2_04093 [Shewanella hafniensis]
MSEVDNVKPDKLAKLEASLARGKWYFILVIGVLYWGSVTSLYSGGVSILHLRDFILAGTKSRAVYLSREWCAIWLDAMDAVKSQKR